MLCLVVGTQYTDDKEACVVMGALQYYFFQAAIVWLALFNTDLCEPPPPLPAPSCGSPSSTPTYVPTQRCRPLPAHPPPPPTHRRRRPRLMFGHPWTAVASVAAVADIQTKAALATKKLSIHRK